MHSVNKGRQFIWLIHLYCLAFRGDLLRLFSEYQHQKV
jgi:hypothetical protein